MKVIIFEGSLEFKFRNSPRFFNKYLEIYREQKFKRIINNLKRQYRGKIEIKIITSRTRLTRLGENLITESYSNYRINLEREKFLGIKNRIINKVMAINFDLFDFLSKKADFYLMKKIFLGNLIEFDISDFLKNILGEIEIINYILLSESYDKVIFFNLNPKYLKLSHKNLMKAKEIYFIELPFVRFIRNLSFLFFLNFIIGLIGKGKEFIYQKRNNPLKNSKDSMLTLMFIYNTKNQLESIKQIYQFFKENKNLYLVVYSSDYSNSVFKFLNLISFYVKLRKIWLESLTSTRGLEYEMFNLRKILKDFYKFELIYSLIKALNNYRNFEALNNIIHPNLAIITDELRAEARLYAKYCKLRNIQSLYIPHGGIPIFPELSKIYDFNCIAVPGELDKNYLINKGVESKNIILTGRTRHDKFYKGEISELKEIKDILSNRYYKFNQKNFSILYITSRVDRKSNERFDSIVFKTLKNLGLLGNLIIKIHPYEWWERHEHVFNALNIKEPIIVKHYDIFQLIKSCDLILIQSINTITGLEAMIVGKPIIVLDFVNLDFRFTGYYKLYDEKEIVIIKDPNLLGEKIKMIMENTDFYNEYSDKLKKISQGYSYHEKNTPIINKLISIINNMINYKSN